jgi:DNA invertase Pin-like site-specific DNA recombinase
MPNLVSYIRVSTAQQGKSGLGIEAQRLALDAFAKANGFEIVAEFVEVHRSGLVLRSRPVDGGERGLVAETLLDNLWQKP